MADDDPLSAALAEIRALRDFSINAGPEDAVNQLAALANLADRDVPRLLAALDAALRHHQRVPLYGLASTEEKPENCPHDPERDWDCHFEDPWGEPGDLLCEGKPEGAVCSSCTDGEYGPRRGWPCDEYAEILAALTGRSVADVLAGLTGKEANGAQG